MKILTRAIVFLLLFGLIQLHAFSLLLSGISEGDKTYDAKKLFNGQDDELCWAFAASNAINYWQDTKSASGVQLPYGTPTGEPTSSYSSDITQIFVDNWVNDGGEECSAFNWWFAGTVPSDPEYEGQLKPDAIGGGYWLGTPYADGLISTKVSFGARASDQALLFDTINEAVSNQFALTCGIYNDYGAHAITLWGCELDENTNEISGLWVSDSDNDFLGNFLIDLTWNEELLSWDLGESQTSQDYSGWYLGDISILMAGSQVPEPSTLASIFGVLALILALARRSKKLA